ncbi:MAG: four helix bundle protein [Verrucomicrobiota bacterium]
MKFNEWLKSVPREFTEDPLWKISVYQMALYATDLGWHDVTCLMRDRRTLDLSSQMYEALGSVAANISEGYSRGSNKDRTRFYEYALGSARESRGWYYKGRHVLGERVTMHRIALLTSITKSLLCIVPDERGYTLHDAPAPYASPEQSNAPLTTLLEDVPMPQSPETHHASRITTDAHHASRIT